MSTVEKQPPDDSVTGLVDFLVAYCAEEEVRKLARRAAKRAKEALKAANAFVGFPEVAFPTDWCAPPCEYALPYVVPGAGDDELLAPIAVCDHTFGVVLIGGGTIKLRSSRQGQYVVKGYHRVFLNRFCPECGHELPATELRLLPDGGNPPKKERSSEVEFSRNEMRRFCSEEIAIYRQPNHGGVEAS